MGQSVSDDTIELLAFYALGVPVGALATQFGMPARAVQKRAQYWQVRRPSREDQAMLVRVARAERIRRHVEDSPSVSLFAPMEKAA